ncbi:MAG: phosphoglycerate kinase, partial [Candidatus Portnoybacteria bacterium]|nr:phosphoglycerate kinase [Candidatus Portnoybacteria bacterium]
MSKIKSLKKIDLKNKRVLVRVDFDVPIDEEGIITDNSRIKGCLSTIEHLVKQKTKVVLISHLGRPEGKKNSKMSLKPIAEELGKLLNQKILFSTDIYGKRVEDKIKKMEFGDVLLLENIRFWKEEEENSSEFAEKIAKLGDIYINEAFAVSHREHASVVGIPKLLPSAMGFLLE